MYYVILAGGEGTRLWPLSTKENPKPLLPIVGNKTLLHATLQRLKKISPVSKIFISTSTLLQKKIHSLLPAFPRSHFIIEPVGRNTAPCIAVCAQKLMQHNPDAIIGVFPSDHLILNEDHFCKCVKQAETLAKTYNQLILLGLTPKGNGSGYGHILLNSKIKGFGIPCFTAKGFIEKPNKSKSELLQKKGCVLWNGGIYIGKANVFLKVIKNYMPKMMKGIEESFSQQTLLDEIYPTFPSVSIDYAITEKLTSFLVVSTHIKRVDVGNFNAFQQIWKTDRNGNATHGNLIEMKSKRNIVYADRKPIVMAGMEDVIVVDSEIAVLVCSKDCAFEVNHLKKRWRKIKDNIDLRKIIWQ